MYQLLSIVWGTVIGFFGVETSSSDGDTVVWGN